MIIHIDKEEVTILEIKIVTLGEMHIIIERIRSG
jgi:hypothetical protein